MLKKILGGFAAVIVLVLAFAAARPADYRVTRSAAMAAEPKAVWAQVNDFKNWGAWSPWAKLDPDAKNTISEPAAGVGATFAWEGNSKVGAGKMTILDSKAGELVDIRLEFFKPMPGVSKTLLTFQPEGAGTRMTWDMSGTNNFVGKLMCLFMDMDKMVGGDFERGLASIKGIVEKPAK